MVVKPVLISGGCADPGVRIHLFLHPAAEGPFIEIWEKTEIFKGSLERRRDEG